VDPNFSTIAPWGSDNRFKLGVSREVTRSTTWQQSRIFCLTW